MAWILLTLFWSLPSSAFAGPAALRPCLSDKDCEKTEKCVNTLCSNPIIASLAPPPPFGITVYADEENCPGASKLGAQWRNQMTALMRANHMDVHWHEKMRLQDKGKDILREINEALLAGRRANLRILVGCSAQSSGYKIRFEIFDFSRMSLRDELYYNQAVTRLDVAPYLKNMQSFANDLLTLDGGPPGILGSRIAFVCKIKDGSKEIYSMDIRGADLRRETHFENLTLLPTWTADMKIAATTWVWKNPDIFLDGKPFLTRPGLNTGIDFHPKSKRFLVASGDTEAQDIFIGHSTSGKVLRRLTHDRGIDTAPSFSPDGSRFVFVSDRLGSPQVFVMGIKGSKARRISWAGAYNSAPAWSSDGRSIAWSRRRSGNRNQIIVADIKNPRSSARSVVMGNASYETPSFSPDGRFIVASRRRKGESYPVIINLRTETVSPLAQDIDLPGPCHQPAWSPVPR